MRDRVGLHLAASLSVAFLFTATAARAGGGYAQSLNKATNVIDARAVRGGL